MTTIENISRKRSSDDPENNKLKRFKVPTKVIANDLYDKIALPPITQFIFIPSEIQYEEKERKIIIKAPPLTGSNVGSIVANCERKKEGGKELLKQIIKETKPIPFPLVPNSKAYWKSLKEYNQYHGQRRSIQFVIPIGNVPHILLFNLNSKKKEWCVPGGYLKHEEGEEEGFQRVWNTLFKADGGFKIKNKELIGKWFRPEVKTNVYPYKSKYLSSGKELIKVYLIQLEDEKKTITFPGNFKSILPCDIYDLYDLNNPELKAIPFFLSKYEFETT